MTIPTFTLNNGTKIPAIGFGTGTKWFKGANSTDVSEKVIEAVTNAFASGFTHIDGAEMYGTEPEIGEAIKRSGLKREDIFITTKVLPFISNPEKALNDSLSKLGLDYVDLYLIHAPYLDVHGITIEEAWKKLEGFYEEGKVKAIGFSNFSIEDIERVLKIAKVKPAVNQIEYNAYLQNQTPGIVAFSQKHGILIEAFGPLAPVLVTDENAPLTPVLAKLAKKYNKTPAQIQLRWTYQNGVLPVTTSQKIDRLKQSLEIFEFSLSDEDVEEITRVGATYHLSKFNPANYNNYR